MTASAYPDVELFIAEAWKPAAAGRTIPVINPATEEAVGTVAHADRGDLEAAAEAVTRGFEAWQKVSAFDRYKLMRKAADILRSRADTIAPLMTLEQGKPVAEARAEALAGGDIINWFAEEGHRAYGRTILARAPGVTQFEIKEPVGPVAAFGALSRSIQSGMVSINHHGLGLPEVPFGGIKDSGYGSEGGADAIDAYFNTKYVTHFQG